MNTSDLYTLLAAPTLSRTQFFTRLLAHPRPQTHPHPEPLADDQPPVATANTMPPELPSAQPPPTNTSA